MSPKQQLPTRRCSVPGHYPKQRRKLDQEIHRWRGQRLCTLWISRSNWMKRRQRYGIVFPRDD